MNHSEIEAGFFRHERPFVAEENGSNSNEKCIFCMSCLPRFWLLLSIYLPRPRLAPYCHPLPPRRTQDGHKITPRWPRNGPRRPQDARDGPRWPQDDPKMTPRCSQTGPRRTPKLASRVSEVRILQNRLCQIHSSGSKTAQNGLRRAKMGPKMVQDGPR